MPEHMRGNNSGCKPGEPINPSTASCIQYSDEEVEFLKAVEQWKKKHKRQFPTCCDFLAIIKQLGYCREPSPPTPRENNGT